MMQFQVPDNTQPTALPEDAASAPPGASTKPKPIAELISLPDFPHSAIGEWVDIGGHSGVINAVVHNSIKVRSTEGTTTSYNFHVLRKLYGPKAELPPEEPVTPPPAAPQPPPEPKRVVIENPDFTAPLKRIQEVVTREDYPQCTFGAHLDIGGYTGVVVEIVNRSLKVRSPEGVTRSYNADQLVKIFRGK